ncbi:MAG: GIY-YIG nuclease family protein [Microgenomates group bacterium]
MYYMYILRSTKDGSFYIGSTSNLKERLNRHNSGRSKYTKARRPWNLAYSEIYLTLSEARKREFHLKSLKSRIVIEKLIKAGPVV